MTQQQKFKKTEIGMIPEDWSFKELNQIIEKIIDYRGKTPKKSSNGISTISARSIKQGKIDYSSTYFISEETFKKWEVRGKPQIGDVLLTTEGPLGELATYEKENVAIAQRLILLRGQKNVLDNSFLKYYLMSSIGQHQLHSRATGTTVQGIKQSELKKILVLTPNISEQKAIAKIPSNLDSKIEVLQQQNSTLEAIGQALFKHWFIDFEFPNEEGKPYKSSGGEMVNSELGDMPKGWTARTVSDILELAYGKALKNDIRHQGDVPVYGSNGQIGWHDEQLVDGPGIVVGRKGNPGIVTWVHTAFFPIDTTFYVVLKSPIQSMCYLFYALRLQELQSLGADSAVPGLNRNLVYMNKMVVPHHKILRLFDRHMQKIYNKLQANDEQSRTLAAIRDALLPKLMSGEIRVPITVKS